MDLNYDAEHDLLYVKLKECPNHYVDQFEDKYFDLWRDSETDEADLASSLKDIPEGESAVEKFYEFCSAIPKHLALFGVIAMLIGALLPSQATISVWLS